MGGGGEGGNWSFTEGCSQGDKPVSKPMPVSEAEKEWLKAKMAWGFFRGTGCFIAGVNLAFGIVGADRFLGADLFLANGKSDLITGLLAGFSLLVAAGLSWVAYRDKKHVNAFFEATRPYGKKPEEKGAPAPKAG